MKSIMKRRELNIGNIVQVGFNKVRVVRDEKVSYDSAQGNPEVFSFWEELSHYSLFC